MLRQIEMILDECLANPDIAVADISVCARVHSGPTPRAASSSFGSPHARAVATVSPPRQLVTPYAEKVLPNPEQSLNETFYGSITSRFAEQARLHPDRPAIYEDDR